MSGDQGNGSKFAPVGAGGNVPGSDGKPPPAKITLASRDDTSIIVTAQFNQKELELQRNVPWQKTNEANKSNSRGNDNSKGGVHLEFTGAEGRSLSLELLFDSYEAPTPPDVKKNLQTPIENLEKMASVREPGSKKEELKRPHRCLLVWGAVLPRFECVIESLQVKYTMFSQDGLPLRATAMVKLKEANVVSVAKKK